MNEIMYFRGIVKRIDRSFNIFQEWKNQDMLPT